jgi:hypothetical protein
VATRRVYVIELDQGAGRRRDPRIPWVYVGSSSRTPEERFEQHLSGYKSSGLVKRFAKRLRPDLYEDLAPIRSYAKALESEHARAEELAGCGFIAHSDGTSHGEGKGGWEEWGAERLEPLSSHLDRAAGELFECAFEPLGPERCARLLHGEPGFWVARFVDPVDPPPGYGLFAHVRLGALEERAQMLAARGGAW